MTHALLHGHHACLVSMDRQYDEREAQILECKPESEHATRLRCMQTLGEAALKEYLDIYDDYRAKRDALDADYQAKRSPLYADYWAKRDALEDDYQAKCAPLYADYRAKLAPLDADYKAKLDAWHSKWCEAAKSPEGCPWDGKRLVGVGE